MRLLSKQYVKHVSLGPGAFKLTHRSTHASLPNGLSFAPTFLRRYFTAQAAPFHLQYGVGPSRLEAKSHPLGWQAIQALVEPGFGQDWKFTSEREKKGFFALGFSRAFSQFFPLTLNDRVEVTCKMHYLALLIDDQLDKMNVADMLSYRERVIEIARGETVPDRSISVEWMLFDTIQLMHTIDHVLAVDLVEGFCLLLQTQTNPERASIKHLGPYLECREIDVGRPFYTTLIRFGANLHIGPSGLQQTFGLESTAFRFMGILNDVYSWDKEWKAYKEHSTDGARPFSAINILAQETGLPYPACKRLMYNYCRELELVFQQSAGKIKGSAGGPLLPEIEKYIKGLEYLMSGIEIWSQWTPRYRQ
ncbi:hypothetical protein N7520_011397 [Penicillium odoratum]|uniref:uncharacterized protein n=1 Tax=Penicillium odoratum TaxID=1167516 RepID=UPI0025484737|nr:uncharacterized protein N7520_011397 [Penicillium odoratum]KAJ5746215.1 hypothetical protein N7520_011397 [Penicillium odoratum]